VVTRALPTVVSVVSVVEKINEPRHPTFKGIMAAENKPVQVLTLSDISDPRGLGGAGKRRDLGWRTSPPVPRGWGDREERGRRRQ
jgi:electron transfer flavoprotein beta subunit